MLKLYTTALSANGRKALAVGRHLALEIEVQDVDVYAGDGQSPEFLAVDRAGKVPVLVDGDLTLTESNAILIYLSEAHGEYRLWSREARRRAEISRWLFWESSEWQPALAAVLAGFVGPLVVPELAKVAPAPVHWKDERLVGPVEYLDAWLASREFVAGEELTLADFSLGGMAMYLHKAGLSAETYPNVIAWYERLQSVPAWKATAAGPWAAR